jgi:hypothetical protein
MVASLFLSALTAICRGVLSFGWRM